MPSDSTNRHLVLVAGSTRSGTSLAAGTLHHLGLHVPQPVLRANDSNPLGFFEPTWTVKFHERLMDRSVVGSVDARPEVFELMAGAVRPGDQAELLGWLRGVFDEADQVVVKDPRASWVTHLWRDAVQDLGGRIGILLMVRHPAEVVASRATYYAADFDPDHVWRYQVRNLAAWVNLTTGVEGVTRGLPRVVARYDDLLADWRQVARRVGEAFDVELAIDSGDGSAHPVDEFVDRGLRRHAPSWSGSGLPDSLIEMAESVWSAMSELAGDAAAPHAHERLDALRSAFTREMQVATAMAYDAVAAEVVATRRQLEREAAAAAARARSRPETTAGPTRRLLRRLVPSGIRRLTPWYSHVEAERRARAEALRDAEQPIVADLQAHGLEVSSLSGLMDAPEPYTSALPVLLEHLERGGYPDPVMKSLGRALAVKPAVEFWDRLTRLYRAARSPGEAQGVAIALAACATKAQYDDLISFLSIAERGESRTHFLRAIKRVGGQRGRDLLESLHDDPTFGKEATSLLFSGAARGDTGNPPKDATAPGSG